MTGPHPDGWNILAVPGGRYRWEFWHGGARLYRSSRTYPSKGSVRREIAILRKQLRSGELEHRLMQGPDGRWTAEVFRPDGAEALGEVDPAVN